MAKQNQFLSAIFNQVRAWFLEITFTVRVYACVCVCDLDFIYDWSNNCGCFSLLFYSSAVAIDTNLLVALKATDLLLTPIQSRDHIWFT